MQLRKGIRVLAVVSREPTVTGTIKKVVVGVGHADKKQVEHMVRMQLPGISFVGPDAVDALAIAMCHAHHSQFSGKLEAAVARAQGEV